MRKDYIPSRIERDLNEALRGGGSFSSYVMPDPKLGQEFHATGNLSVRTETSPQRKNVWVGVETTDGIYIPIKSLMNISSMVGYYADGDFTSEYLENGRKKKKKYTAKVVDDFDFSLVFQPSSRKLLDFIREAEFSNIFKGKIIRYLGNVVRPYDAKKDSPSCFSEKYKAGMKRAIIVQLWEVRLTLEEQKKKDESIRLEKIRQAEIERRHREEEIRREKASYNQRNSHVRDRFLLFNGLTHSYSVNGLVLQSVTDFVEHCFPSFDSEEMASRVAARTGQKVVDVLAMWNRKGKESRDAGTEMHRKIESFYQLNNVADDDTFRLFRIFAQQIVLNPYRTEWPIYDSATNLAGTVDFVDYSNGKYIIYDWKRSDKLIENGMPVMTSKYDQKALPPISHVEDSPFYHYALQLSLYKYIIEKNYGLVISELRLGIFHPTYNKPYVLKVPYMKTEVETLMSLRNSFIL